MQPETVFAVLALCFGMLFMLFIPPGQAPDDHEHFYRAYQVSTGAWFSKRQGDLVGGELPQGITTIENTIARGINGRQQHPDDVLELIYTQHLPEQAGQSRFVHFPNMALNFPLLYVPQALGITIGKMFNASPVALHYLARLTNLLVWIAIVFFAIKTIPMSKFLMMMVALLPMSLFLAASTSADAVTNGLCFLFIALVMKLAIGNGAITRNSLYLLGTLGVLVSLSKLVYIPLVLLVLLIPTDKFSSARARWTFVSLCLGCSAAAALLWSNAVLNLYTPYSPGQTPDPKAQMAFILADPIRYLAIVTSVMINQFNILVQQIIGAFGWLDTYLPWWFYIAAYIALVLVSLFDQTPDVKLSSCSKALILFVLVTGVLLIYTGLYIKWVSVGSTIIMGMQGRYFISLSLLFWLLFYQLRVFDADRTERYICRSVVVYCALSLSYVSWVLADRYYVV